MNPVLVNLIEAWMRDDAELIVYFVDGTEIGTRITGVIESPLTLLVGGGFIPWHAVAYIRPRHAGDFL